MPRRVGLWLRPALQGRPQGGVFQERRLNGLEEQGPSLAWGRRPLYWESEPKARLSFYLCDPV